MYFGENAVPGMSPSPEPAKLHLSLWCLVPMWMALVPLLVLGLWWPSAVSRYLAAVAAQLSSAGAP
jgi:hydrogenase-4 component F